MAQGGYRGQGSYNGNSGGYNQYNNGGGYGGNNGWYNNDGGWYGGNSRGYGGSYGKSIPPGVNQFGFSISRGGGRGRGKTRGGNYGSGGNKYNYNSNPEWYGDDTQGAGGCFDDGSFSMDEGYVYSHEMPFPFKRGGARGTQNMVWQRGMPRWGGGPKKEVFKKKWQQKKRTVVNPAVIQEAGEKKSKKKKKRGQHSEARAVKFRQTMTLKNRYRSVRQNRSLSIDDQLVLVFLKKVAQEVWTGDGSEVNCINFAKFASRHPNALKLFTFECKKKLDEKYPDGEEGKQKEKLDYLQEAKKTVLNGFKKAFKQRAANEDMEVKEKLFDLYVSKLSGEAFTNEDIPVDEDYLFDKNHSRLEQDFINEFKYDFVFNCYECFKFKPNEQNTHTKDLNKRLRYHLDNQIIPFLIVESTRAKALVKSLPAPLNEYLFKQGEVHQENNEVCLNQVVELMVKNKENVTTPLSNYVSISDVSTGVLRDFADCILLFDRFVTYAKFRLSDYSPHILLPKEQKLAILNDLVDQMYRESLDIILKEETFKSRVFPELEKDEEFIKAAAVKEEETKDEKAVEVIEAAVVE